MWIRRLSELTLIGWMGLVAVDARAAPDGISDGSLSQYRERFKQGMDLYTKGSPLQAIGVWEPIYRDLGEQRGYRLAYNLGVAYAAIGDAARSAERLQAFVIEMAARRERGELLEPTVSKEEADAKARLGLFAATLGRVRMAAGLSRPDARLDTGESRPAGFIVWVTPGRHAITFAPGTDAERTIEIDVEAGAIIELVPPAAPPTAAAPETAATSSTMAPTPLVERTSQPLPSHASEAPPFSPALLAVSGGMALAVGITAIPLEVHANALYGRYTAEQTRSPTGTIAAGDRSSFSSARTWAYFAVGGAAGLGAVTAGLATWYFVAKVSRSASSNPPIAVKINGAAVAVEGRF